MADATYEGWAILELMGHRRLGGYISEAQIAGASLLRIDVYEPGAGEIKATQFYATGAIYAITPSTEDTARRVSGTVAPVQRWELPALPPAATVEQLADEHLDKLEIEAEAIEHEHDDEEPF